MQKHTTGGIPRWSPTLVLVAWFSAYVWQSGRDAQFSLTYGHMYYTEYSMCIYYLNILFKNSVREAKQQADAPMYHYRYSPYGQLP